MCDFAPRQGFNITHAVIEANMRSAGIFPSRHHVIAASDTVMLLSEASTTPVDSLARRGGESHAAGVVAGEGEGRR